MENDSINLNKDNYGLIESNCRRIGRLFSVHIEVKKNDGGTWLCELSPKAASSSESAIKAKIYIKTLLGQGEGFSTSVVRYDQRCKAMILTNKDDIEKEAAVVIVSGEQTTDIKILGPLDNILLAKNVIENLIHLHSKELQCVASDNPVYPSHYESSQISEKSAVVHNHSYIDNVGGRNLISRKGSSEQFQTGSGHEVLLASEFGYHGLQTPHTQMSSQYQDSSSESSDDEDVNSEIQNDPEYKNKVEFALKLGYNEVDLLQALKKLGLDAGQNELLSELIKQGTSTEDTELFERPSDDESGIAVTSYTSEPGNKAVDASDNLRHIIIDGSNIAMSHGNKETFSCHGIKLAVDWFRDRGHKDITVFVPQWRKETSRSDSKMKDQTILNQLEKEKVLVFTPARRIGGKRVVCYDDRYILKLAVETDGIVVSNDNYRDLLDEKEEFKKVIEERLLMYSFVNDRFMPPDDPLGRNGPTLDAFLQKESAFPKSLPPLCPYGSKKCTYGNKCKFYHPERRNQPQKTVTEKLAEQAKQRMTEVKERTSLDVKKPLARTSLCRTKSLNPGEIGKGQDLSILPSNLSGSASNLATREEETSALFNQKLSENLRKMAREKDSKETHMKTPEKKGKKKSKESQSSSRWNFRPERVSPNRASSRGTSPVSNLIVPRQEHDLDDDDDNKFISGHLLLAKKLSDEANETDKSKKDKQLKESPLVTCQNSNLSFNFTEIKSSKVAEPKKSKQKLQRQPQKQTLSRQLSLQGTEDPRLRQGHTLVKPQYSLGVNPRQSLSNRQSEAEISSMMKDFIQIQNAANQQSMFGVGERVYEKHQSSGVQQGNKSTLTRMQSEGPQFSNEHLMKMNIPSHTPLARMQSAPDPYMLQQQQIGSPPKMTRQNSSSDTQLNKLDSMEDTHTLGPVCFLHNPSVDSLSTRGTVAGTSTAGPVSFQFGGPPASMSHTRPISSNSHSVQQFIPREMNYHYHQTPQQLNPFHVHPQQINPQQVNPQQINPHQVNPQQVNPHQVNPQQVSPLQSSQKQVNPQSINPQQVNPHIYEGQQQQVPYRGNNSSYGASTQTTYGSGYSGIGMNTSLYNPQVIALSPPVGHPSQQGPPLHMPGQSPMGAQSLNPGPPHFLDQQTSRIWGNSGTYIPGGGYTGHSNNYGQTSLQVASNMPMQQPNRASPVPCNSEAISVADPRYELYCNLCKLFPEDKVRRVMTSHPEIDNPNDICAYLIGAK